MKMINLCAYVILFLFLLSSCAVSNNMYVHDAIPAGKKEFKGSIGIGTGIMPKIDSMNSMSGQVYFNDKITFSPILSGNFQGGLGNTTDWRCSIHLPFILGGFGLRLGLQQSFFNKDSKFNIAIGTEVGMTLSKDTIKYKEIKINGDAKTRGGFNADFYLPISYQVSKDFKITLAARYSFSSFDIRSNVYNNDNKYTFKCNYPIASLGLTYRHWYIETSAFQFQNQIYPLLGVGLTVHSAEMRQGKMKK